MNYERTFDFETTYDHPKLGELTVYAAGGITQYYPATFYRPNGDPGDPEEGGECEYTDLVVYDSEGNELDFDTVINDYDWLDSIAEERATDRGDDFADFDDEPVYC